MVQTRTISAKKNIFYGFLGRFILLILNFVSRNIFIDVLGEELLGVNDVFANIIQILSLAELGLGSVVGYSLYKPLAEQDNNKVGQLIQFYKKIYNTIALAVLVIGLLLIPVLKYIINTDYEIENIVIIYLIFLADTVSSYLFTYKYTLLSADQKGYIASQYEIAMNITRFVLQVAALILFKSIIIYLLIKVVLSLLNSIRIVIKVNKEYSYILDVDGSLDKEEKREIANVVKSGFIYKLSSVLLNSTDNILLSVIVGTVWVGYLSNYNVIGMGLSSFYTIIFSSLTAGIGNLVWSECKEKRLEVFKIMMFVSSWLAIIFSVCYFVLSEDFVSIWIGKKFVLNNDVVLAKTLIMFLSCSLQPVFCFREALGLYRKTKYVMFAAAIINIVLSVILGNLWGMSGILFASIIAMLVTYIWYEPILLYRECFETSSTGYFVERLKELFLLMIGLAGMEGISMIWKTDNWIEWVIKALIIFMIVNFYCYFIYRKTDAYNMTLSRVKGELEKWRRKM